MFETINRAPDAVCVKTSGGEFSFTPGSAPADAGFTVTFSGGRLTLTADDTPVISVIFRWNVTFPRDTVFCGDAFERGYGDFEFRGMDLDRIFPWFFICRAANTTAYYGVKTLPGAMCHFKVSPREVTLYCDTRSGCDGVRLGGRTLTLCQTVSGVFENKSVYETGIEACRAMVTKAVFPEKPVYGFNNWYYAYGESSEAEILENSRHLARLTQGFANRPYMIIDDCWQKLRPEDFIGGPWRESNDKFPDMKGLARKIADMGNLPGIWIRPLQNRAADITDEMYLDKEEAILDPSRRDVLDYIAEDVKTITGWGYRLIKHDYTTNDISGEWGKNMSGGFAVRGFHFSDVSLTTAEIITRLYKTIYDAAEGKALILGCNTCGHLGTGYFEINRDGDDTSGRDFNVTRHKGVNTLAFRIGRNNIFYKSDADCVGILPQIDHVKNREWLRLLAKSGTPLFVSVAPDTLGDEDNALLSAMLKIASEEHPSAQPYDLEFALCPERWKLFDGETEFAW